jgi:TonB family protein
MLAVRCLGLLVAVVVGLSAASFADIKTFNEAVQKGDYKTAATEARATWATWDKSDPDTATVAREFGFAALITGDYEAARQYGQFLVENGATLTKPDDQPAVSAVLFCFADFRIRKGEAERNALRAALLARNAAPGLDMTSVIAWEGLYVADWNASDWESAHSDASAAAAFLGRNERAFIVRIRTAEVQAAAALFLDSRIRIGPGRNALYNGMADVHDRIVADIDAAKSDAVRNQLWPLKWRAEAWTLAIGAFLDSSYAQIGSNISTALEHRALAGTKFGQVPEDLATANLPQCTARWEGPGVKYPKEAGYRGMVGGVIARVETDADGKVLKVEIMATVPAEAFSARVIETYSKWRLRPEKGVAAGSCRLNSRNNFIKMSFRIL